MRSCPPEAGVMHYHPHQAALAPGSLAASFRSCHVDEELCRRVGCCAGCIIGPDYEPCTADHHALCFGRAVRWEQPSAVRQAQPVACCSPVRIPRRQAWAAQALVCAPAPKALGTGRQKSHLSVQFDECRQHAGACQCAALPAWLDAPRRPLLLLPWSCPAAPRICIMRSACWQS